MATATRPTPDVDPTDLLSPEDREVIDATIEAITSALPVSLSPEQTAAATTRLLRRTFLQPTTVARHLAALGTEQVRISLGMSDVEPDRKDRRFADDWFTDRPGWKRLAQRQVALEQAVDELIADLDLDDKSRLRSEMLADIVTSTIAPTNHLLGNPAALKETWKRKGANLVDGLRHAAHDLRHNNGMPSMVDTRPFVAGETVATTPGHVVFSNPVIELIQYTPTTTKVHARPLMIVPPQINKYYVLDLAPGRSLVEHLVGEGQQVFMVSWRNPGPEQRDWGLDTYLAALLEASDAVREISGSDDLNLLGVCAGGITTAALLGHLAAVDDDRIHSASFLVTILDWDVPSTVGTMVSGPTLQAARRMSRRSGVLDGDALGAVFAWLRPNDLVWNYWVNNYLMGRNPAAFDILSWNVDATNLPAELHADFLDLASTNAMTEPGAATALDTPIDLSKVTCDSFVVGAVTDHITPWTACFQTVNLLGGTSEFVLSSQGHIQALVNPSGNPKGAYHTGAVIEGAADGEPVDAEAWLAEAEEHAGSWWDHWTDWLADRAGSKMTAPKAAGSEQHPATMPAPGTYVLAEA